MAQWYTQLVFKGNTFLGDSLADMQEIQGISPPGMEGNEQFTMVIVSGYALYGQLHGYYALGVAHVIVDPTKDKAFYVSEESALHRERVETLSPVQKDMIRDWLMQQYPTAWDNSTDAFKQSLKSEMQPT